MVVLGKDKYYQLTVRYCFNRAFKWSNYRSVVCILEEDAAELNYWFDRTDCIFRDVAYLKVYILTLKWKGWQKRLYLAGEDSERANETLRKAFTEVDKIGEKAKDWLQFLSRAIKAIERRGFIRIEA